MKQTSNDSKSDSVRKHITVNETEHQRLRIMAAHTGRTITAIVSGLINAAYSDYRSKENGSIKK